jgi:ATP-dependent RNA helicase
MADGIDRKADERMELSTSKEVTVAPTFEASESSRSLETVAYLLTYLYSALEG